MGRSTTSHIWFGGGVNVRGSDHRRQDQRSERDGPEHAPEGNQAATTGHVDSLPATCRVIAFRGNQQVRHDDSTTLGRCCIDWKGCRCSNSKWALQTRCREEADANGSDRAAGPAPTTRKAGFPNFIGADSAWGNNNQQQTESRSLPPTATRVGRFSRARYTRSRKLNCATQRRSWPHIPNSGLRRG